MGGRRQMTATVGDILETPSPSELEAQAVNLGLFGSSRVRGGGNDPIDASSCEPTACITQTGGDHNPSSPSVSDPTAAPAAARPTRAGHPVSFVDDYPAGWPRSGVDESIWERYDKEAKRYDEELLSGWNENLDVLLIFTGLFSAILTAFLLSSYSALQYNTGQATVDALTVISAQLAVGSSPQALHPLPFVQTTSGPSLSAMWINGLWSASLSISLLASLAVIVTKQWIRAYRRRVTKGDSDKDRCVNRQARYDGVKKWHLSTLIVALPLAIEIAVIMFLSGLVPFTWSIHPSIGKVTAGIVGIAAGITIIISIFPLFSQNCPYETPLTLLYGLVYGFFVGFLYGFLQAALPDSNWQKLESFFQMWLNEGYNRGVELEACALEWLACRVSGLALDTALLALSEYRLPGNIVDKSGVATAAFFALNDRLDSLRKSAGQYSESLQEELIQQLPALACYVSIARKCFDQKFGIVLLGGMRSTLTRLTDVTMHEATSTLPRPSAFLARLIHLVAEPTYRWQSGSSEVLTPEFRTLMKDCIDALDSEHLSLLGTCLFFQYMAWHHETHPGYGSMPHDDEERLLQFVCRVIDSNDDVPIGLKRSFCEWHAGIRNLKHDPEHGWDEFCRLIRMEVEGVANQR